jgi:CheY-like chemotaxis protein
MTMDTNFLNRPQTDPVGILVAERGRIARECLSELFREEGYRVFEAPDSDSAIHHINNSKPLHVILTDLEMPGWQAIIDHGRASLPDAFILCMAAPLSIYDATEEAQRLGAQGHFLKPLVFKDLRQSIQKLLAGNPLR